MSGLPWLAQIPILKYLFGQGQKSKTDNETVFALMPHIVRRLDIDDLNIRPVDIGTQNVVEARHMQKASAAPATVAPVPSGAPSSAAPANPGGTNTTLGAAETAPTPVAASTPPMNAPASNAPTNTPTVPADAGARPAAILGPVLSIDPAMVNQPTGGSFAMSVTLNGGQNVFSVPVQVNYDPKVIRLVSVADAGALSKDGAAVTLVHRDDAENGTVQISLMRPPGSGGITPQGPLFTMMFVAKAAGQGSVSVGKTVLKDPSMGAIPASGSQAMINVR
jgi:general secretion pathway protein D